ncbi:MAG: type I 3-dehydroquinate dehydratase, partial [bacterium]
MIIVSITGPRINDAFAQVASSTRYADIFEFRLDHIEEPPLSMLLSSTRKPFIATCRPKWEGGRFDGTEHERMQILEAASVLGASYVDLELKTEKAFLKEFLNRRNESKVILSHHQFAGERIAPSKVYARMRALGADIFKFVYAADDVSDIRHAITFLKLAKGDGQKAVAIAMGEYGEPTRILYKKFGGWGTYAATEDGKSSAPGQIPASELKELYRSEHISSRTKLFGVIGNPLKQSKGVYIHNPLFYRAKRNSVYCRLPVKNLRTFVKEVAPFLSGFSVTIPHKQAMMKYLDRVDATASAIG